MKQWSAYNGKMNIGHLLLFFALCLGSAVMTWAGEAGVTARLDAAQFTVDQAVQLTVTVKGSGSARPDIPRVEGLRLDYRGQSSQMQWINGRSSSSVTFMYSVQAERPGTYTIPPVKVSVDGHTLETEPITCTVLPGSSTGSPPFAGQGGAGRNSAGQTRLRSGEAEKIGFMRIIAKKKTAYSGELLPFTIKAYFRQGLHVTINSAPAITGESFVLQHREDKPQQTEEVVNGIPYTVLTWDGSLSGIKAGEFPLEVELDATLLVRQQVRPPSGMFGPSFFDDDFFNSFFGNYKEKEVKLISPKQSMTILDLPEKGRPEDFSGAIGTFSLMVSASPTTAHVGDPLTLKMIVTGTGNFDRVQSPVFREGPDWKTYTPSSDFEDQGNGRGRKKFEQAIIPKNSRLQEIPPVTFSYFDPTAGEYMTLRSDPIGLHLQDNGAARKTVAAPVRHAPAQEKKISPPKTHPEAPAVAAPLRTEIGKLYHRIRPIYTDKWFIGMIVLSLLFFVTAVLLGLHRKRLLADPSIPRRKEVYRRLKERFRHMENALAEEDSSAFQGACRAAIQDYFGFIWQQEPRAITLADLQTRLANDSPLLKVFREAEHGGYTGIRMSPEEMRSVLNLVKKELDNLS